jgi:uncharacterized membrane protein (UPF0127 family)
MAVRTFVNQSKATVIGDRIAVADSFLSRFLGLMGRRSLEPGGGLWITPSAGVHTFWMRMGIDVVALDRSLRVVKVDHGVRPWRLGGLTARTRSVLELPSGQARACLLETGDQLVLLPRTQP